MVLGEASRVGIATRPVLGVLIAAAVLVAVGLLLHLSRDASGSLETALNASDDDTSSSSLIGRGPGLVAPPAASTPRAPSSPTDSDSKPEGPVTLHVSILDHRGNPVSAVLHVAVDESSTKVRLPAGETPYQHSISQAATFSLRAESPRRNIWSRGLRIFALPGSTHPVTLVLQGPRFRGRVIDARSQEPVVGAFVRPSGVPGRDPHARFSSGMSVHGGEFDFELQQGEGTGGSSLLVSHGGYLPQEVPLPATADPIEVRLEPRYRCRGRVLAEGTRIFRDATVRVQVTARAGDLLRAGYEEEVAEARRTWEAGPRDQSFEDTVVVATKNSLVDNGGGFDFPLRFPGEVRGYVRVAGYLAEPISFFARRDAEPLVITVVPTPTPKAKIRFVHADGAPFRGLRVWIGEDSEAAGHPSIQFGKTDAAGWYDTSSLRAGASVRISVAHPLAKDRTPRPPPMPPFTWTVRHFETITVGDP